MDEDIDEFDLEATFQLISDQEAEELAMRTRARVRHARLNSPGAGVEAGELGDVAREVVAAVAVKILEGSIPIRSAGQARDVAVAFHQISRLEQGKSTANPGDLPRAEREAIIAELAEKAAERAADKERGLRLVQDDSG